MAKVGFVYCAGCPKNQLQTHFLSTQEALWQQPLNSCDINSSGVVIVAVQLISTLLDNRGPRVTGIHVELDWLRICI